MAWAATAVVLLAIGVRGAWLCMQPRTEVIERTHSQRWGTVTLRAPRGDILDRDGRALATTAVAPNVVADPQEVEDPDELAALLAPLLERDASGIAAQLRGRGRYTKLATHVSPGVAHAVRDLHERALWIERTQERFYPEQALASQVVGFVDASGRGRGGLERTLNTELSGGTTVVERQWDYHHAGVDGELLDPDAGVGHTVWTTLDRSMQRAAERALAGVVERSAPKAATAVVMDVETGDLLAIANVPTFDPNQVGGDPTPRRDHAVQDWFEPGSVMKPFTLAAAVEEGLVTETSLVDCENGVWCIGRSCIRDDHRKQRITLTEVLKYSSNIGAAKIALELGPQVFLDYLRAFGFGQRSGVPLPGELAGSIRHPDRIRPIELATTAFGQGMTVTAVQLAAAVAAIADGGVLHEPRLVTDVVDRDGVPVRHQDVTTVRRVVSEETAAAVTRMMTAVTEDGGTGRRGRVAGYTVAAKTGTAQKAENGGYGDGRVGSFLGFLPAEAPRVAIVVIVDEPSQGSRYGGTVAGPAFAEIGAAAMRYYGIAPNVDQATEALAALDLAPSPGASAEPSGLEWVGGAWRVPDLRGLGVRDVLTSLADAGFALSMTGSGRAISQVPSAGGVVAPGQSVAVVFQ